MFTHIMVGTNDVPKSRAFYAAALGALGYDAPSDMEDRFFFMSKSGAFGVGKPADGEAATHANGGTIGFVAQTHEQVDAFHAAGLANHGTCEGEPGLRPNAPGKAYLAYLRDPDGNKICAYANLGE